MLEPALDWTDSPPAHTRTAQWLRLFLITWDPLEHGPVPRPRGLATVNVDGSGGELVVYLLVWAAVAMDEAAGQDATITSVHATGGRQTRCRPWR